MRFACIGDTCVDRYLPATGFVGGNAVNVAVRLAGLGHAVSYFGAVGEDDNGERVRASLVAHGIDIDGLRRVAGQCTARTDIATEADGERRFVFEDFGACLGYRASSADLARLAAMDHVHIGWLADGGDVRRYLVTAGISVSQDLSVNAAPENLEPTGLSVAFASAIATEAETVAAELLRRGARLAVVTSGADGSFASDGRTLVRTAAEPVEPVDTTGAGDAFIAGFLDRHLRGGGLAPSLSAGARLGRAACLHAGGFPQVPFRWEI